MSEFSYTWKKTYHNNIYLLDQFEKQPSFVYTGGRGFPDRMRPSGDRYQEPPRDRGAPWDPERRREREHPRDRSRPHDESRDRERRPRGELSSTGSGPKHWEERRGGRYCVSHHFNKASQAHSAFKSEKRYSFFMAVSKANHYK